MTSPDSIPLTAALIGAIVAIAVFIAGQLLRERDRRVERRRLVVVRMLDTVEKLVRSQIRPSLIRNWNRPDVELVLLVQRLALDLGTRELVIANWVWAQTQRVMLTTTSTEFIASTTPISTRLIQWHRKEIGRKWFQENLSLNPVLRNFKVPQSVAWKRNIKALPETALTMGGIALIWSLTKRLLREL